MPFIFRHPPKAFQLSNGGRTKQFFESWCYKQSTGGLPAPSTGGYSGLKTKRVLTVIPSLVKTLTGAAASVHVFEGTKGYSHRFDIPTDAVALKSQPFELRMADSVFRLDGMDLRLKDLKGSLRAELRFGKLRPPARSPFGKLILDPHNYVPFMHHLFGITSLDHSISGFAVIKDEQASERIDFSEGRGYLEKDWGQALPSAWLRIQTNAFDPRLGPCSLSFSLARLSRWGIKYRSFICLLLAGGREYRFTTFSGARINLLENSRNCLRVLLGDARYKVELLARHPDWFKMTKQSSGSWQAGYYPYSLLGESSDSQLRIILKERNGPSEDIVFDATGTIVATTMVGDLDELRP